jgi:hypothetical protein
MKIDLQAIQEITRQPRRLIGNLLTLFGYSQPRWNERKTKSRSEFTRTCG